VEIVVCDDQTALALALALQEFLAARSGIAPVMRTT
jgi:hypothetical protein